ncbi:DUF6916 family protein [Flavobacterium johnsoniae]|jgi:hypothetical protein|uniref:DUF6916 domain-containing protein n=1 Tax=Flavobacterium johnsoniae (strain ATCC 17061 / DSM 2064 / JCM 8514 / BCRC 14874 / CCUG 350202 / NBRC 14942 / NCIMB 11054 / UW101) TaxID=376686 RepID=A5FGF1_FLAJ1|nr:hypothetical protein [Flavobacterium johnsoniae]ABQ05709.1 hypothetical protein Fjoh_2686 [Flavobacterium johnsoniae UW101]OXE95085.1 hypothetical protein B0A63_25775 [Flavobacterium johnsoniae UW101]WQG81446.1 hypothetical protein SR927_25960 [Flavobacterium johnsoniae UW101]SHM07251.1 hypothetical protein SAMN05444146_5314 [Flavobacterium johnsoniae]
MDITLLSADNFNSLLNAVFTIKFSEEIQLDAELISVTEFNSYSPLQRTPFSLVFRTQQKNEYYQQGIFTVIHPEEGNLELFLTPLGFDEAGMKYEAVFS